MTTQLSDTDVRRVLKHLRLSCLQAHQRNPWCDLAEYEDAAMAALSGCLERFDPGKGVTFFTYLAPRLRGALADAWETHNTWSQCHYHGKSIHAHPPEVVSPPHVLSEGPLLEAEWLASLAPATRRFAVALLQGYTYAEFAAQEGVTEGAIWQRALALRRASRTLPAKA